jgi:hypothetical protein
MNFIEQLKLVASLFVRVWQLLWRYPVMLVPLIFVYIYSILVYILFRLLPGSEITFLIYFIAIYILAFLVVFSGAIGCAMLKQLDEGNSPKLGGAIKIAFSAFIPLLLLTLIWYIVVIIISIIESLILSLVGRSEAAKKAVRAAFSWITTTIRMMVFIMVPVFIFEKVGLGKSFKRLKQILTESPVTFGLGVVSAKIVFAILGWILFIILFIPALLGLFKYGFFLILAIILIMIINSIGMYFQEMFSAGLYLSLIKPDNKVTKEFFKGLDMKKLEEASKDAVANLVPSSKKGELAISPLASKPVLTAPIFSNPQKQAPMPEAPSFEEKKTVPDDIKPAVDYIRDARSKGYSDSQIRDLLSKSFWADKIEDAFKYA